MTYQWHKVSDLIDMAEDASDLMFPEDISQSLYGESMPMRSAVNVRGEPFVNIPKEVRPNKIYDGAGNVYASREEYDAALLDMLRFGETFQAATMTEEEYREARAAENWEKIMPAVPWPYASITEFAQPLAKPSIWQRIKRMIGL